jgi:dCTP deaminase
MAMSDVDIKAAIFNKRLVIRPMTDETIRENGVDLSFSDSFRPLKETDAVYDSHKKYTDEEISEFYEPEIKTDRYILKKRQKVLVKTLEWQEFPKDTMAFCNLRSTYARHGVYISPTAINAGWKGYLVIGVEGSEFDIVLNKGDRFLHVIYMRLMTQVDEGYHGAYQDQKEIVLPQTSAIYDDKLRPTS